MGTIHQWPAGSAGRCPVTSHAARVSRTSGGHGLPEGRQPCQTGRSSRWPAAATHLASSSARQACSVCLRGSALPLRSLLPRSRRIHRRSGSAERRHAVLIGHLHFPPAGNRDRVRVRWTLIVPFCYIWPSSGNCENAVSSVYPKYSLTNAVVPRLDLGEGVKRSF